jgi:glycerol uptake facilitator-like aquaporin
MSGNYEHLWIYIVATIIGAVIAAQLFLKLFQSDS